MARRKLSRRTTTIGSIASHNPDMVSALSSPPLSPLPPPPESPPPSAFPGEKRPNHEDRCEEEKTVKRTMSASEEASSPQPPLPPQKLTDSGNCGRERLQRHRNQVAGSVWIPDVWGKEEFLKDWTDCVAFDRSLVPSGLVSAKSALIEECRRSAAGAKGVRINLGAN
ncbi:hypothetical protein EJ110_NYTH56092 [Nymphaea thermarum]|nr:hypothetical protein EJ110_NYTH56092 [Nymphaea thermarum]